MNVKLYRNNTMGSESYFMPAMVLKALPCAWSYVHSNTVIYSVGRSGIQSSS